MVEIEKYKLGILEEKITTFWVMSHVLDKLDKSSEDTLKIKDAELVEECNITRDEASKAMTSCRKAFSWSIQLDRDTFEPITLCRKPTVKEITLAINKISNGQWYTIG